MKIIHGAKHPSAEVIYHEHCADCGKPYYDNSRNSAIDAQCRAARRRRSVRNSKARKRGEDVPCNHAGHPVVAAEAVAEIRAAQALLHERETTPRPLRQPEAVTVLNLATWEIETVMR